MNWADIKRLFDNALQLPEAAQRQLLVGELYKLDALESLELIASLCDGAALRQESCEAFLLVFAKETDLSQLFGYDKLAAAYEITKQNEDPFLGALLMRRQSKQTDAVIIDPDEDNSPRITRQLNDLTLGERREFAKQFDAKRLEMLLFDTDHLVIRYLLNNPKVLEEHVLRLASRRPQSPEALQEIFMHPRWSSRYQIKKALTFNPHTPPHVACSLVNFIQRGDLKLIVELGSDLSQGLVARAKRLTQEVL